MLVVSLLLISNILPQMTEEDLAAQMEADRLLQATLRAQVRQTFFVEDSKYTSQLLNVFEECELLAICVITLLNS